MLTAGFNHVATLTNDAQRLHAFYEDVFEAEVVRNAPEVDGNDAVWLSIIKVGDRAELNVFQIEGNTEADRQVPMFGRGRLDHFALQAADVAAFETIRDRLSPGGGRLVRDRLRSRAERLLPRPGRAGGGGLRAQSRRRARRHQSSGHAGHPLRRDRRLTSGAGRCLGCGGRRKGVPMSGTRTARGQATEEAWGLLRSMLDDMATMVGTESETELELVEGYRALARITALAAEISFDVDPAAPWFFPMNSWARMVGGPNPDGDYQLAMIDGARPYRITGTRNSVTYLGFQVLAGRGLTPRRMAAYVSDTDLALDADGRFALVLATLEPDAAELDGAAWVPVPEDASAVVVRQYVADRSAEVMADLAIAPLDPPGVPRSPPMRPSPSR